VILRAEACRTERGTNGVAVDARHARFSKRPDRSLQIVPQFKVGSDEDGTGRLRMGGHAHGGQKLHSHVRHAHPHACRRRGDGSEFPQRDVRLDPRRREGTAGAADAHQPTDVLRSELEYSASRAGDCRAQASPGDPNLLAVNGLASSTSTTYRDKAGCVMRVRFSAWGMR
jgi:hypothetical protein